MNEDRLRRWVLLALGAAFALHIYFVQELLAALLLLGAAFLAIALLTVVIWLMQGGGQRAVAWVEVRVRSSYTVLRRGFALAAELSRKIFHRPHSRPAP